MAVADVPAAVLSTVGVAVTGFDCLEALLTGIEVPSIHRGGAVAGIPDQVGGFEGHGVCVHVASMDQIGGEIKGWWTARRLSHPVQEVCHRFLILLIGCETIREASGNLTVALGCGREVTTLGQDVGLVGVGSGFVHVAIIRPPEGDLGGSVDSPPTVTSPSLQE